MESLKWQPWIQIQHTVVAQVATVLPIHRNQGMPPHPLPLPPWICDDESEADEQLSIDCDCCFGKICTGSWEQNARTCIVEWVTAHNFAWDVLWFSLQICIWFLLLMYCAVPNWVTRLPRKIQPFFWPCLEWTAPARWRRTAVVRCHKSLIGWESLSHLGMERWCNSITTM